MKRGQGSGRRAGLAWSVDPGSLTDRRWGWSRGFIVFQVGRFQVIDSDPVAAAVHAKAISLGVALKDSIGVPIRASERCPVGGIPYKEIAGME